jgi:hypothetical protein
MMEGSIYEVKLSSPLQSLFLDKGKLHQPNPPFHIDVKFKEVTK